MFKLTLFMFSFGHFWERHFGPELVNDFWFLFLSHGILDCKYRMFVVFGSCGCDCSLHKLLLLPFLYHKITLLFYYVIIWGGILMVVYLIDEDLNVFGFLAKYILILSKNRPLIPISLGLKVKIKLRNLYLLRCIFHFKF